MYCRLRSILPLRFLVLVVLLGACGAGDSTSGIGPVPAGMQVRAQDVYYEVTGSTAVELWAAMRAEGPQSENRRVFGHHSWNIRWNYRSAAGAGHCRLRDVRVELVSTTTLPRWTPPREAPDTMVAQWNAFVAALTEHERGHQANAAAAAREVLRSLRALQTLRCETISTEANALAHRILDRYREQDRRYDQETRSGATQGAVWPPDGAGRVRATEADPSPGR